jgi:hypothetical protein
LSDNVISCLWQLPLDGDWGQADADLAIQKESDEAAAASPLPAVSPSSLASSRIHSSESIRIQIPALDVKVNENVSRKAFSDPTMYPSSDNIASRQGAASSTAAAMDSARPVVRRFSQTEVGSNSYTSSAHRNQQSVFTAVRGERSRVSVRSD